MLDNQVIINKIRSMYGVDREFISLHEPQFIGNEKKYLNDCIDSTFVSSVGQYVNLFEKKMTEITGARYAVATTNGTSALHLALTVAGVQANDLVITQALSFIATANAIRYIGAQPFFIDVDLENLSMSDDALRAFLEEVEVKNGIPTYRRTGQRVAAVVPMHTFGFPAKIDKLAALCEEYGIPLIEDAAESIGSLYQGKSTGTFGKMGVFSFNGNKIVTSGGGGMIVTDDPQLAQKAKHLSTQAKISHPWEFQHDELGYNYRCPNINAALACAQLESLDFFIENKRSTAAEYAAFFADTSVQFISETTESRANYWLNAILFPSEEQKESFLKESNAQGINTRPTWNLLNEFSFLNISGTDNLENSRYLSSHLVNIPSSVRV